MIQSAIDHIFANRKDMEKTFCNCNIYNYKKLKAGQVFCTQWLKYTFTAPQAGRVYQIATKSNLFIAYVFVCD